MEDPLEGNLTLGALFEVYKKVRNSIALYVGHKRLREDDDFRAKRPSFGFGASKQ